MKIINNVFKVLENERWTMLFDAVIVVINVFFAKVMAYASVSQDKMTS